MDGGLRAALLVSPLLHLRMDDFLSNRWGPPQTVVFAFQDVRPCYEWARDKGAFEDYAHIAGNQIFGQLSRSGCGHFRNKIPIGKKQTS